MADDWAAAAKAISSRLEELGMTQLDAAAKSKVAPSTIRELQYNKVFFLLLLARREHWRNHDLTRYGNALSILTFHDMIRQVCDRTRRGASLSGGV